MGELLELLRAIDIGDAGFAGVVLLAIIMIFRGDIVPRSSLEAMRSDKDKVIESTQKERDIWREAYEMSEEARRNSTGTEELLELGRTTVHLLQSFHEKANGVT